MGGGCTKSPNTQKNIDPQKKSLMKKLSLIVKVALKSVNSHVQKTFEIIPPQELQIGKSIDFEEKKGFTADHTYTVLELANLSPALGSKLRKIYLKREC